LNQEIGEIGTLQSLPGPSSDVIIEQSGRRILSLFLRLCVFLAGAIFMLRSDVDAQATFFLFRYPGVVHGVGVVMIAVCCLIGAILLKNLRQGKAALVLNANGLTSNLIPRFHVPSNEILGFEVATFYGQSLLAIKLVDPARYLRDCGFKERWFAKGNLSISAGASPLVINPNTLQTNLSELMGLCNSWLAGSRRRIGGA
jgi:hypothetical protein